MKEIITACPRNCYSTCTFRVLVEDNKIIRILPFKGNQSTPEGPCIKGLSYIERSRSADRLYHPLIRNSNGSFEKISSEKALDLIAGRLSSLRERHGSRSVLWYRGSGMSGLINEIGYGFWKAFGGTTITYGNLCWPAGLEAVRLTLGTVKHNVPWDISNADTIIIWGKNPAETNIQEMVFVANAREKGAFVAVIDPLRTPTADKAEVLYRPNPGTDGALALAISKVIIDEELYNRNFIEKHVKGFDEFKASLTMTAERAEEITSIPAIEIYSLARRIAEGKRVTFIPGYGIQRRIHGGQTIRAILAIAVITGNIGRSGTGFNYANLQSYIFDDTLEPLSYYPGGDKELPFRRSISMAKLAEDMLGTSQPELKAAWVERGNPALQSPDSGLVRKAFERLEFRVVVDQFMTDTAKLADIILPAKDIFEQSDIIGSYWSPYVQFKPKVLEPEGEVMPESEIWYNLALRLGIEPSSAGIPEPGNENIEEWLRNRIKGYSGLSLDDLKDGPVIPEQLQQIAYCDMKFETPSGKIELLSEQAMTLWGLGQLPEYIYVDDKDKKYPLSFLTPNSASRIHSQFGNLSVIKDLVPSPAALISPIDAMKRGIKTGDKITLFNDRGEIQSEASLSSRVPEGIVVLPNGIWFSEGGGGNTLIEGKETDMGYGSAFHDNKIDIRKASES